SDADSIPFRPRQEPSPDRKANSVLSNFRVAEGANLQCAQSEASRPLKTLCSRLSGAVTFIAASCVAYEASHGNLRPSGKYGKLHTPRKYGHLQEAARRDQGRY